MKLSVGYECEKQKPTNKHIDVLDASVSFPNEISFVSGGTKDSVTSEKSFVWLTLPRTKPKLTKTLFVMLFQELTLLNLTY